MRRVDSDELPIELEPILLANVTPSEFLRLFPVEMREVDMFAAPEPSIGRIVQLSNGQYLGVTYGQVSGTLAIRVPPNEEEAIAFGKLFDEVPLKHSYICGGATKNQLPLGSVFVDFFAHRLQHALLARVARKAAL